MKALVSHAALRLHTGEGPGSFPLRHVLFLLVFASTREDEAVLAQDALNGHVTEWQVPGVSGAGHRSWEAGGARLPRVG
jgi:hypothetical protein